MNILSAALFVLLMSGVRSRDLQMVTTRMGTQVLMPEGMALSTAVGDVPSELAGKVTGSGSGPVMSEWYTSADQKSGICFTKKAFPKGEDEKDPEADRIEDVIFTEVDIEQSRVNRIAASAEQGWPTIDLDLTPGEKEEIDLGNGKSVPPGSEMGFVHYRVYRTKNGYFECNLYGPINDADRAKILESLKIPSDLGEGTLEKWGPTSASQSLDEAHVGIWSPIELKEDKDESPPSTPSEAKSYTGEFGYCSLSVAIVPVPAEAASSMNEATLDKMLQEQAKESIDEKVQEKATFTEPSANVTKLDTFRFITYHDETLDGRIDVIVKNNILFIFKISVPHGMLDSEDLKRVVGSYSVL